MKQERDSMGDVIRETKVLVKNDTLVADRRGWSESVGRSRVKVERNVVIRQNFYLRVTSQIGVCNLLRSHDALVQYSI